MAISGIPQIIVEVYSKNTDDDLSRMLTQGGSLVRLVNRLAGQAEQKFVLMALYFRDKILFTQYLLFQQPQDKNVRIYDLPA